MRYLLDDEKGRECGRKEKKGGKTRSTNRLYHHKNTKMNTEREKEKEDEKERKSWRKKKRERNRKRE